MERVCIFIDGSNFYHALKDAELPTNVDFGKLAALLAGSDRRLSQTYYYNTPLIRPRAGEANYANMDSAVRNQQRFFNALRFIPNLTVKFGRFQKIRQMGDAVGCPSCGNKFNAPDAIGQVEKGVDIMLATDMLILAFKNRYDVAVLVSSDADFKYAIEAVKSETGKVIELRQVTGSKAYDLISACSAYYPIEPSTIHACLRTKT